MLSGHNKIVRMRFFSYNDWNIYAHLAIHKKIQFEASFFVQMKSLY